MIKTISLFASVSMTASTTASLTTPIIKNYDVIYQSRNVSSGGNIGSEATEDEISSFGYKVPNYQWFTKISSDDQFGYADVTYDSRSATSGKCLCEYVSLTMILTYLQLFKTPTFNQTNFQKYFKNTEKKDDSENVYAPSPRRKGDKDFYEDFAITLWKLNNKKIDLLGGSFVQEPFRKWINQQGLGSTITDEYSAAFWHTSTPEEYMMEHDVPVMVTWAYNAHSIVIYGYNSQTDTYLAHYGWSGLPSVIINKSDIWSLFSVGYWNIFYPNYENNVLDKNFQYKNKMYSWDEIESMDKTAKDIVVSTV